MNQKQLHIYLTRYSSWEIEIKHISAQDATLGKLWEQWMGSLLQKGTLKEGFKFES